MALAPQITLTATFQDMTGAASGSAANPCIMRIDLCGFGQSLPSIAGTSMIAQIEKELRSTDGTFNTKLWGNDVITPGTTYYQITIIDGYGRVVQAGLYSFTGTGTVDLSNAQQLVTRPALTGFAAKIAADTNSITLPTPIVSGTIPMLFYNGAFKAPNIGYELLGNTFNFLDFIAMPGDSVFVVFTTVQLVAVNSPTPAALIPFAVVAAGVLNSLTLPTAVAAGTVPFFFYNDQFKVPGIGYNLVDNNTTFNFLDFTAQEGDSLYVLYVPQA